MTFFETFSQQFAKYKRENKKSLKGLKTEEQAKKFLSSKGQELKKDLEEAIKNKEKINFAGLPKAAKSFFGSDFVAKYKRFLIWENAELRRLSPGTFKFNEKNSIFIFLEELIESSKGGFFSDYITDGNKEETEEAIQQAINKAKDFSNIEDIFNYLNQLTNREDSNANWEAWGLFASKANFKLFLNFK